MQKILLTALVAGCFAGLVSFGVQSAKLTPLIQHAEVYEKAAEEEGATHEHEHAQPAQANVQALAAHEHEHDENAWEPAEGFERNAYRALADIGVGVGYALLLVGAFSLRGEAMNAQRGLLWGLAGFATFSLAPGFGLSPELPGSMAADLLARQTWWLTAASGTAAGLALLCFGRSNFLKIMGLALLVLPHLLHVPHPEQIGGSVPPELNAEFAAASLATAAIFWAALGLSSGWFYGRKQAIVA